MNSEEYREDVEVEENEDQEDENFKLNKYDISAYPADYTIKTLLEKFEKTIIVPEFQRRYVWGADITKQSRLIESFLLRLPVPQIFLFQKKDDKNMLIIDGSQRVNTLRKFYKDKLSLKGVQEQWIDKKYSELDEIEQEELDNSTLRAIIIRQIEPDNDNSSMFYIFERLNTGGVTLSPMEIRKAIFYGNFYNMLEELNNDNNWKLITGKKTVDNRLRDIEWLLRISSFLCEDFNLYQSPMKDYLNSFMNKNAKLNQTDLYNLLKNTFEIIVNELGIRPFHIPKKRLNIAAMDAIIVYLAKNIDKNIDLKTTYRRIIKDVKFIEYITARDTSKTDGLKKRFKLVESYFDE